MNKTVQTKEDNSSIQESVIQDKVLNEAIQENTKITSEEVHIISNFPICLLSVYVIYDCIIDILLISPEQDSVNKDIKGESNKENEKKKRNEQNTG
jgi:hypothetical protein